MAKLWAYYLIRFAVYTLPCDTDEPVAICVFSNIVRVVIPDAGEHLRSE